MLTTNGSLVFAGAPAASPRLAFVGWQPIFAVTGEQIQSAIMGNLLRFGFAQRQAQTEFERLVRPHLDHLYKLAYRFTGSGDGAEDLIQDLLLRLYSRRHELEKIQLLGPWLTRVMYRLFVDQVRHDARTPYVSLVDEDGDTDPYAAIPDPAPGPDVEFELNLDRARLAQAWQELSPEHRAVLALHEIEGYTLEELETMLELNRGTVKSRLHRARARLVQLLAMEPSDSMQAVKQDRKNRT